MKSIKVFLKIVISLIFILVAAFYSLEVLFSLLLLDVARGSLLELKIMILAVLTLVFFFAYIILVVVTYVKEKGVLFYIISHLSFYIEMFLLIFFLFDIDYARLWILSPYYLLIK